MADSYDYGKISPGDRLRIPSTSLDCELVGIGTTPRWVRFLRNLSIVK